MAARKAPIKRSRESAERNLELPEVALAAIASYKNEKDVSDFINFLLGAFERNCEWLNDIISSQASFSCALLVGSGPNRFQTQEIIYPTHDNDIKLEVEFKDSDDHDKVAIAALTRLNNLEMENLMKFMKTRLYENSKLKEDLLKGKSLGLSFAVLRPFADKQYRLVERIVIGSSMKCLMPSKKRRRDDRSLMESPLKKNKKRDNPLIYSAY